MAITVTINGTDRSSSIQWKTLRMKGNINQQVDQCSFEIWKYGTHSYVPTIGQEVVVTRNSVKLFGGVILRIDETVEASTKLIYKIECADYGQYLKRRLVTERYTNTTLSAIIADLIDNYTAAGDALTYTNISGDLSISSFSFDRISVADCLQKLADALSYVWYVDYDKDIHFFPKNAEVATESLTDSSQNYIYDSLKIVEDLSQIKNSIFVQGGEVVSASSRTEYESGDGTRVQFPLANKFNTTPTVTVGGVGKTVGVEFLDSDASFQCMWNFNEKYIRFTSGNTPASGTNNITIAGTYLYPIVVKVPAPASIASYGTYEFAITDKSIRSEDEAIERAQAALTGYRAALYEGEFRTYTDGFRSGQVLTINSTQRGKNISVLIQSVSARLFDPSANAIEYTVTFATLKSIGIIDYLQSQLRNKEVIVDDDEVLTNFNPLEDEITFSDSLATPTADTGPYVYGTDTWGYSVWS